MVVIVTIMILISEHFLSFIKLSLQEGSHIYIYIRNVRYIKYITSVWILFVKYIIA